MGRVTRPGRGAVLLLLACGCALFAVFVASTGGIDTRIAGIAVRSRSWERPAVVAVVLALLGLFSVRRSLPAIEPRLGQAVPAVLIAAAAAVALAFGTFAAGGADSSGYVSQAELLAQGRLTDRLPLNPAFSWPDVPYTLTPLGYTRGPDRDALVPIYPPGLPLLMAPLALVHPAGVFLLIPLCAAIAVWCCLRLGRELGDPLAGTLAALLLSCSPTFLIQAVQPMSDVPVTACWLGAIVLARRRSAAGAALSGLTASVAVMIRPNLAPLALFVVAACGLGTARRLPRMLLCAAAMLPALIALGIIQQVRYGSPLASGYGSFSQLFSAANIRPNFERYPRWLTATHSPFIWVWLMAPVWILRAAPAVRGLAWICYGFCLAVFAAYLPYVYFRPEEWSYTRFLLPALPLMLLLGAAMTLFVARRLAPRGAAITTALAVALATWCGYTAATVGVFRLRDGERKYPVVGAFVRDRLPRDAFVMALQHSGSVRYYSGRPTLRWDLLDRGSLDRAIGSLRDAGYEPFVVVDAGEDEAFRERFAVAGQRSLQALTPIATLGNTVVYGFR